MNKTNNNIYEHRCLGCQCYSQDSEEKTCIKCGVKQHKIHMDKFGNDVFVCRLKLFCEERRKMF
jgi:rRNA maturation endonuclease Nob1